MVSVRTKTKGDSMDYIVKLQKKNRNIMRRLKEYGMLGCQTLAYATPFRTGETAMSWSYEIKHEDGVYRLDFNNAHVENGVNIAIILQYGHPTRNGGWVEGRDYINPAIQPIFDEIAEKAWGEIKSV